MTEADALEAIAQTWRADWPALQPTVPYALDNESFSAVPAWARVSVQHTARTQITQGSAPDRKFEMRGNIFVELYAEIDAGGRPLSRLSDDARKVFEGRNIALPDSSDVINVFAGRPANEATDGAWHSKVVVFPFRYVETR